MSNGSGTTGECASNQSTFHSPELGIEQASHMSCDDLMCIMMLNSLQGMEAFIQFASGWSNVLDIDQLKALKQPLDNIETGLKEMHEKVATIAAAMAARQNLGNPLAQPQALPMLTPIATESPEHEQQLLSQNHDATTADINNMMCEDSETETLSLSTGGEDPLGITGLISVSSLLLMGPFASHERPQPSYKPVY